MDASKTILVDFLLPFARDLDLEIAEKLDLIFDIPNRQIYRMKVLKAFRMPGYFWFTACQRLPGFSRTTKKGYYVYVRIDIANPFVIDVEFSYLTRDTKDGPCKDVSCVFSLTPEQFDSIRTNLGPVEEICREVCARD
ncbi:MAG: hypothetical protein NVS9B9_10250 [Ktedonobacteraceae bacterium]